MDAPNPYSHPRLSTGRRGMWYPLFKCCRIHHREQHASRLVEKKWQDSPGLPTQFRRSTKPVSPAAGAQLGRTASGEKHYGSAVEL